MGRLQVMDTPDRRDEQSEPSRRIATQRMAGLACLTSAGNILCADVTIWTFFGHAVLLRNMSACNVPDTLTFW